MTSNPNICQFGKSFLEPETKPVLEIYRFRVYKGGRNHLIEPEIHVKQINFKVYGNEEEFLEVRISLDDDKQIEKVRSFHFSAFDGEMADYITKYIVKWWKRKHRTNSQLLNGSLII